MSKCKCINISSLKGKLILNETYTYNKDDENILYPYYIYDIDNFWNLSLLELDVKHIASVSEKFFNEHFIDIKKQRTNKLNKINENNL